MENGANVGMSGHNFDAFVSSQRTFNDYDIAAKIQEKYWRARQKFLAKIEKKEDSCIVLSDSKLDAKLEIYHSIDKSCSRLTNILENYQNYLFIYANEENSLGILLKECGKIDKTKAGEIMAITGKGLTQASHHRIRLYMPLMRLYQEIDTFSSRAVEDTAETVSKLESKRSQYRASLLWMKDISEKLDPDVFRQLDKFRRVQNQVRNEKKAFDSTQMDVVQKIDLLMASRCNLLNQILASYQATLLDTLEKNFNNFRSLESIIKKEDIYEYEFKTLKQLNPLKLGESEPISEASSEDLIRDDEDHNNNTNNNGGSSKQTGETGDTLIDLANEPQDGIAGRDPSQPESAADDIIGQLESLFGKETENLDPKTGRSDIQKGDGTTKNGDRPDSKKPDFSLDLLYMDSEDQVANLLSLSENAASQRGKKSNETNNLNLLDIDDSDKDISSNWPDELSKIFNEPTSAL